jgi:ABC-type dipeptide/oligopeptide/nickel transport system ATPase component
VPQAETLQPELTPRESLEFTVALKLPHLSAARQRSVVQDTLGSLGMLHCAQTAIGDGIFVHGISGGERKRASISTEITTTPDLLFLDEPTSQLVRVYLPSWLSCVSLLLLFLCAVIIFICLFALISSQRRRRQNKTTTTRTTRIHSRRWH